MKNKIIQVMTNISFEINQVYVRDGIRYRVLEQYGAPNISGVRCAVINDQGSLKLYKKNGVTKVRDVYLRGKEMMELKLEKNINHEPQRAAAIH